MELTPIARAEQAEQATGGDEFRVIGEAALAIFGWQDERYKRVLRLLEAGASLDAAMSLVPEGWFVTIIRDPAGIGYAGVAGHPDSCGPPCATPALALVSAALRARAQESGHG